MPGQKVPEGTVLIVFGQSDSHIAIVPLCIVLFIGERIWKCMAGENKYVSVQHKPS